MEIKVNLDPEQIFKICKKSLECLNYQQKRVIEVFYLTDSSNREKIKILKRELGISKARIYKIKAMAIQKIKAKIQ